MSRFPRMTFRSTDRRTGAWFEARARLDAVTGEVLYERVGSSCPLDIAGTVAVRRQHDLVDERVRQWATKRCGRPVRAATGDGIVPVQGVS